MWGLGTAVWVLLNMGLFLFREKNHFAVREFFFSNSTFSFSDLAAKHHGGTHPMGPRPSLEPSPHVGNLRNNFVPWNNLWVVQFCPWNALTGFWRKDTCSWPSAWSNMAQPFTARLTPPLCGCWSHELGFSTVSGMRPHFLLPSLLLVQMLGFAHMTDSKPKMQVLLVVTRMDPDGNFYNKYINVMWKNPLVQKSGEGEKYIV